MIHSLLGLLVPTIRPIVNNKSLKWKSSRSLLIINFARKTKDFYLLLITFNIEIIIDFYCAKHSNMDKHLLIKKRLGKYRGNSDYP